MAIRVRQASSAGSLAMAAAGAAVLVAMCTPFVAGQERENMPAPRGDGPPMPPPRPPMPSDEMLGYDPFSPFRFESPFGVGPYSWISDSFAAMENRLNDMIKALKGMTSINSETNTFSCAVFSDASSTNITIIQNGQVYKYTVSTGPFRNCTQNAACGTDKFQACIDKLLPADKTATTAGKTDESSKDTSAAAGSKETPEVDAKAASTAAAGESSSEAKTGTTGSTSAAPKTK